MNDAAAPTPQEPQAPALRILTPGTTPEEVAAIVAVLASLVADEAPAPRRRPEWNAPQRMLRPSVTPGPAGWRASTLPR